MTHLSQAVPVMNVAPDSPHVSDPVRRALLRITNVEQTLTRNLVIDGHRTSIRIDAMIWQSLADIASAEKMNIHDLASQIARYRKGSISLTAAIRMFVVGYLDNVGKTYIF